jgi:hypothetical protein
MANLSLIFAGISAASSIVQAVKSALETNRLLRKEDVLQIAAEAEQSALADRASAEEAAGELEGFDEEMEEVVEKKIRDVKTKWKDAINRGSGPADWTIATDDYRADTCGILRNIKQLNGGRLPRKWVKLWTDNQCS